MRATLVVPTLNEAESVGHVLRRFWTAVETANRQQFRAEPIEWEALVVDGDSTDGTGEIARREGARVLIERRRGYGRAYRTGFGEASGDLIVTMDGDATYPAEMIPVLVRRLLDEGLDFLSADRLYQIDRQAMTTEHRIGNWVLNTFLRIAYGHYLREVPGRRIRDSQSGMWVFRRSILPYLTVGEDGMAMSEEIKLEVVLHGFRFEEVPIRYAERWGAPKLSSWRDGGRNLLFLFRKRLEVARLNARGELGRAPARASGNQVPR